MNRICPDLAGVAGGRLGEIGLSVSGAREVR